MSAFIVSDKHIATLVVGANELRYIKLEPEELQKQADLLMKANVKSVNHRYGERTRCKQVKMAEARAVKANDLVQLARRLDYQCCEPDDWERSKAYHMLNEMLVLAYEKQVECRLPKSDTWSI